MADINVSDFFVGSNQMEEIGTAQYQELNAYIEMLRAVSRLSYHSYYIIDYHKKNFLYVSDNHLFLAGYTVEEVARLGYDFYLQSVVPEDLNKLLNINRAGFEFLYSLRSDEWTKYTISYNFRMRTATKETLLVNHQLTPLRISPDGHLWLAVCAVSLPTTVEEHDAYISCANSSYRYALSSNHRQWKQLDKITLKKEEQMIIFLASQDYTTEDMAHEMCKSIDTIKKYRKALFERLGTDKISEAIACATLHKLI